MNYFYYEEKSVSHTCSKFHSLSMSGFMMCKKVKGNFTCTNIGMDIIMIIWILLIMYKRGFFKYVSQFWSPLLIEFITLSLLPGEILAAPLHVKKRISLAIMSVHCKHAVNCLQTVKSHLTSDLLCRRHCKNVSRHVHVMEWYHLLPYPYSDFFHHLKP